MICTVDVDIQSANPDFPLKEWKAFKGSPTSLRIRNVPRKVGAWDITEVNVKCVYPDNTAHMVAAVLTGCVWVTTIPASHAAGFVEGGYSIEADGTDERGNVVTGYRLGEGKVTILDVSASAHAVDGIEFMRVFDTKPDAPLKGDFALDVMEFYDGAAWRGFGAPADYSTVRTNAATGAAHAVRTDNPHGTTAEQVGAYDKDTVDEKINQFAAHYLTANEDGDAFATAAALKAATAYYYAGELHTPDKNDYCIVRADEDHQTAAGISPTTRYFYVGDTPGEGEWVYAYTINETSLTQAQIDALDSGIDAEKVEKIDEIKDKRDKTDLAVYEKRYTNAWTLTDYTGNEYDCTSTFDGSHFSFYLDGTYVAGDDTSTPTGDETEIAYQGGEEVGFGGTARRHFVVEPSETDLLAKKSEVDARIPKRSPDGTYEAGWNTVGEKAFSISGGLDVTSLGVTEWDVASYVVDPVTGETKKERLKDLITGLAEAAVEDKLPIALEAKTASFMAEDGKRYTVAAMPATLAVTLPSYTGDAAKVAHIFEARFDGSSLTADASVTFDGGTATTMDTDCGTVKAGKIALMSAFWNGATWDVSWKNQG